MRPGIFERSWRRANNHIGRTWRKTRWIISHRLERQPQQIQIQRTCSTEATLNSEPPVTSVGSPLPVTAAARVGPARRQRAAESEWENEGGALLLQPCITTGHGRTDEPHAAERE